MVGAALDDHGTGTELHFLLVEDEIGRASCRERVS
jgi:hypothetical protein